MHHWFGNISGLPSIMRVTAIELSETMELGIVHTAISAFTAYILALHYLTSICVFALITRDLPMRGAASTPNIAVDIKYQTRDWHLV